MTRVILFGSYFRLLLIKGNYYSAFVLEEVLMSIRELDYEQSLLYNEVRSASQKRTTLLRRTSPKWEGMLEVYTQTVRET